MLERDFKSVKKSLQVIIKKIIEEEDIVFDIL